MSASKAIHPAANERAEPEPPPLSVLDQRGADLLLDRLRAEHGERRGDTLRTNRDLVRGQGPLGTNENFKDVS